MSKKPTKLPPAPLMHRSGQAKRGFSKLMNIRKSPLGDLGVEKEKQAFEKPSLQNINICHSERNEVKRRTESTIRWTSSPKVIS